MNGFFKPLRRKIGVITLGLACVLIGAWIKSFTTLETVQVPVGGVSTVAMVSTDGHLVFGVNQFTDTGRIPPRPYWIVTTFQTIDVTASDEYGNLVVDLRICHIGLIAVKTDVAGSLMLMLPYWSIVIPLSLISAWLLLSKPRAKLTPFHPPG